MGLLKERERETVKLIVQCRVFACHHQAGVPVINFRSTFRTSADLCKNMSLAILFSSNGNSYTVSTQSGMCIHTDVRNTEKLQRKSFRMPCWARVS